jgi:hypothetical protein
MIAQLEPIVIDQLASVTGGYGAQSLPPPPPGVDVCAPTGDDRYWQYHWMCPGPDPSLSGG